MIPFKLQSKIDKNRDIFEIWMKNCDAFIPYKKYPYQKSNTNWSRIGTVRNAKAQRVMRFYLSDLLQVHPNGADAISISWIIKTDAASVLNFFGAWVIY